MSERYAQAAALSGDGETGRVGLSSLAGVFAGGVSRGAWTTEGETGRRGDGERIRRAHVRGAFLVACWGGFAVVAAAPLQGQSLGRQVSAVRDGAVGFRYAAAPGVFGTDDGTIIIRRDGHTSIMHGSVRGDYSRFDTASCACQNGPVRVVLEKRAGAVTRLDVSVGDGWPVSGTVRDLGEVQPQAAANYLVDLVPDVPRRAANEAMMAASLGRDVVLWRRLLPLARDRSLESGKRKQVVFWLGQEASDAVLGPL
ncbi:MAG: hypothetical protein P8174_00950, partial [Gemmatimonadota bacterium]